MRKYAKSVDMVRKHAMKWNLEKKKLRIFIAIHLHFACCCVNSRFLSTFFVEQKFLFGHKNLLCYFQRYFFFFFFFSTRIVFFMNCCWSFNSESIFMIFKYGFFFCYSFSLPLVYTVFFFFCSSFFSHFSQFHLIWCDFCQSKSKLRRKKENHKRDTEQVIESKSKRKNGKVSQLIVIETQIKRVILCVNGDRKRATEDTTHSKSGVQKSYKLFHLCEHPFVLSFTYHYHFQFIEFFFLTWSFSFCGKLKIEFFFFEIRPIASECNHIFSSIKYNQKKKHYL